MRYGYGNLPEIADFVLFFHVAQAGSFTAAARRVDLSQPRVSERMGRLEDQVGAPLFVRKGRGIELTYQGQVLLDYVTRGLDVLANGVSAAREEPGAAGRLRLGAALTIGTYLLPSVLALLIEQQPALDVQVATGRSDDIRQMVLDDEVDLGLVRYRPQSPLIQTDVLGRDPIVFAAPPAAGWVTSNLNETGELEPSSLNGRPFIVYDKGSDYWASIQNHLVSLGVQPQVVMELDSMEAAKHMVQRGLGVSFLPRISIREELERGLVCEYPIQGAAHLSRLNCAIWLKSRQLSEPAKRVVELLKDEPQ